jgi:hypothetical protein
MECGGGPSRQQTCLCQRKCAGANRHRYVGILCRPANPLKHCLAFSILSRDHNYLWSGSCFKSVVRYDFHPPACMYSSLRPGMLTSWNTSHGPQKSMITAPSETRNATGILPCVGGLRGFKPDLSLSECKLFARSAPALEKGTAAANPNTAVFWSNSLRFICQPFFRILPFRHSICRASEVLWEIQTTGLRGNVPRAMEDHASTLRTGNPVRG